MLSLSLKIPASTWEPCFEQKAVSLSRQHTTFSGLLGVTFLCLEATRAPGQGTCASLEQSPIPTSCFSEAEAVSPPP